MYTHLFLYVHVLHSSWGTRPGVPACGAFDTPWRDRVPAWASQRSPEGTRGSGGDPSDRVWGPLPATRRFHDGQDTTAVHFIYGRELNLKRTFLFSVPSSIVLGLATTTTTTKTTAPYTLRQ
eukprot:1254653-Pyramimonas_sp.AAC.1